MLGNNSVLALIPARGGSKGIKGKNITNLNDRPLIWYTLQATSGCKYLDQVHVSTDDLNIKNVCDSLGYYVPRLRPDCLSGDNAVAFDVMKYELEVFKSQGQNFDLLIYLQPTSPLRTHVHINAALEKFKDSNADSLVSVVKVPHQYNPAGLYQIKDNYLVKCFDQKETYLRQAKPNFYARNGAAIYIFKAENILNDNPWGKNCLPFEMNFWESVDIDSIDDLKLANFFIKNNWQENLL